jgi:hypothetical protein
MGGLDGSSLYLGTFAGPDWVHARPLGVQSEAGQAYCGRAIDRLLEPDAAALRPDVRGVVR